MINICRFYRMFQRTFSFDNEELEDLKETICILCNQNFHRGEEWVDLHEVCICDFFDSVHDRRVYRD